METKLLQTFVRLALLEFTRNFIADKIRQRERRRKNPFSEADAAFADLWSFYELR